MNNYYKKLGLIAATKEFKDKQLIHNLYKKPPKDTGVNMPHFHALEDHAVHQADLMFLPEDKGYKYVLVVVDVHSRLTDAEPLKVKTAEKVVKAFQKIYDRGILEIPKRLEVDHGSEFKSGVKEYFKSKGTYVRVAETGRHRQQALVERRNQMIQVPLWKQMISKEMLTNESNSEWVDDLPIVIKQINKQSVNHPPKPLPNFPVAHGSSQILLDVGTKVRVALDNPEDYVTGNKLHGKFRSTDFRWSPEIRVIKNVLLMPGKPPMYQLDGNFTDDDLSKVTYTKNQLQVVPHNEQLPPESILKKKEKPAKPEKIKEPEPEMIDLEIKPHKDDESQEDVRKMKVGDRVSLLWDNPKEWFNGTIEKMDKTGVTVKYDDGEVHKHRLLQKSEGKTWKYLIN